jgi:hypothetical protein
MIDECRRGDGPLIKYIFRNYSKDALDFHIWLGRIKEILKASESPEEFACEASFSFD